MAKRNSQSKKDSEPTSPLKTQEEQDRLTQEEILALGEGAARLLNDDLYNLAHELALSGIMEDWIQTEPHNDLERERLYHEAQALGRVARRLQAMLNAAQQINLTEAERAERDLHRYEDEQGFTSGPDTYN